MERGYVHQDVIDIGALTKFAKSRAEIRDVVHEFFLFDTIDSTQRVAMEMAQSGMPGGVAILAEAQEAGRGQRGHVWFSPPGGNLYLSLFLTPCGSVIETPLFMMATLVSLWTAIREVTALDVAIKWPNDLQIDGKKVAGVLVGTRTAGRMTPALMIGIGLNVNVVDFPESLERTATSIAKALGHPIDRNLFLAAFFSAFCRYYADVESHRIHGLHQTFKTACEALGQRISLTAYDRTYEGVAEDIAKNGDLILRMPDGHTRLIPSDQAASVRFFDRH